MGKRMRAHRNGCDRRPMLNDLLRSRGSVKDVALRIGCSESLLRQWIEEICSADINLSSALQSRPPAMLSDGAEEKWRPRDVMDDLAVWVQGLT